MAEIKPKRTTSTHKESANNKIAFVLKNKYYNSPNSLMASIQYSKAENPRLSSAYRRSNTSSNSMNKNSSTSTKPMKNFSGIQNMKGNLMIKNSKISSSMKQGKSENFRKVKHKIGNGNHSKSNSKSNYMIGGSTVISLKNSQNLFSYPVNKQLANKHTEDANLVTTGE